MALLLKCFAAGMALGAVLLTGACSGGATIAPNQAAGETAAPSPTPAPSAQPLARVNFESESPGPYGRSRLESDWGEVLWTQRSDSFQVVSESGMAGNVLRVDYPAGAVGPAHCGGQFVAPLEPSDELWLSYRVKFSDNFDFRKGGKLPGLNSGRGQFSGGQLPVDGDGWSARFVWTEGGQINLYLYVVDAPGPWGEVISLGPNAIATPGRWHTIVQRIRLNSGDQANGVLEAWFDGVKGVSQHNRQWRRGERGRIDSLFFSTFHGGNSDDWAPSVDSVAYFDEFAIFTERPAGLMP